MADNVQDYRNEISAYTASNRSIQTGEDAKIHPSFPSQASGGTEDHSIHQENKIGTEPQKDSGACYMGSER